jgi:hypothetical protein
VDDLCVAEVKDESRYLGNNLLFAHQAQQVYLLGVQVEGPSTRSPPSGPLHSSCLTITEEVRAKGPCRMPGLSLDLLTLIPPSLSLSIEQGNKDMLNAKV